MPYDRPQFYRLMRYAARADRDVVDLVSGSPDWGPPPALRAGLREYAERDTDAFAYPPSDGIPALREAIAARRSVDAERVVVTNGAGEANYLAIAAALDRGAGSEVVLLDPAYPYYPGKAALLDARVRTVPATERGTLDVGAVADAVSVDTACIVVTTPNNPTGAVYDAEQLRELVSIAEDPDAILVSDEVYDHFDYSGRFASALSIESPNCVVTNAFSKTLGITGLRVGYTIVPPALRDDVTRRHLLINVTSSRPAQFAVLRALRSTDPDYYAANRRRLRDRITTLIDGLDAIGAESLRPDGGFYVMARFDGWDGTMAAAEALIDEVGVAMMPGATFGDAMGDWFRLAVVSPRIDAAVDRLRAGLGSG